MKTLTINLIYNVGSLTSEVLSYNDVVFALISNTVLVSSCSKSQKKDLLKEDICKTILVSDIHTESKIDSLVDIMKAGAMTSIRGDVFVALLEQMVTAVSLSVTQRSSTTNYNEGLITNDN